VVRIYAFLNYNLTGLYFIKCSETGIVLIYIITLSPIIGDRKTSKSLISNAPPRGKGLSSNANSRDVLYRKMPRGGPGGGMGTLGFD
jgi:hypothetical protein